MSLKLLNLFIDRKKKKKIASFKFLGMKPYENICWEDHIQFLDQSLSKYLNSWNSCTEGRQN